MTWWQYLLGFGVTSLWLGAIVMLLCAGLWVQGWLAGRKYGDRSLAAPYGELTGFVDLRLLPSPRGEDRLVKILPSSDQRFSLVTGEILGPPTPGRISDGQSIPGAAWWLIGSPLTGRSRDIAIGIHDEECARRRRAPEEAHGIMYAAMRSRGMWWRGPIMFAVLLNWGTSWEWPKEATA